MNKSRNQIFQIMIIISAVVFFLSILALLFGNELDEMFNVIGIRVATLLVAFASFCASSAFSLLVFTHNRTVSKINDDTNKRAELFRELQFASSNYSIIEFMDRMLIYMESSRYVDKYVIKQTLTFHMIDSETTQEEVFLNPEAFDYVSVRIPFRVVEGKMVSSIYFDKLIFERGETQYVFMTPPNLESSRAFLLYNEQTKRNNVIINLIVGKKRNFFLGHEINIFSKIKSYIVINSLLGVQVKGVSELYFTNPEQKEGDGTNTYKINSANFTLTEMPKVGEVKI
ncbi:MAG: hypothetical protein IH571_02240 [Acholeplasmataceae bacterium]|nr:hypothetical protein [Acholeplasmataceae bacterium]